MLWPALARYLPQTDIFHFYFGKTLVPKRLNMPILKATRKRSVMHFLGADTYAVPPVFKERVRWHIDWQPSNADVFLTKPVPFVDLVVGAIAEVTGRRPELSTTGGTSDARFIKDYCSVLEFGLVGQTMHQANERTAVADLTMLTAVYRKVLEKYFG